MTTDEAFPDSAELGWRQMRAGLWLQTTHDGACLRVVKLWAGAGFRYRWSLQAPDGTAEVGIVNDSLHWAEGDAELALWAWRARVPRKAGRA